MIFGNRGLHHNNESCEDTSLSGALQKTHRKSNSEKSSRKKGSTKKNTRQSTKQSIKQSTEQSTKQSTKQIGTWSSDVNRITTQKTSPEKKQGQRNPPAKRAMPERTFGKKEIHPENVKIIYTEYRFSFREAVLYTAEGCALAVMINLLFYQSVYVWIFLVPVPFFWLKAKRRACINKRLKLLSVDFREALNSLAVSMQAGYSAEQAFSETERNLANSLGREACVTREFAWMNRQIAVSVPIEVLLLDFAGRTDIEDIENFAAVFAAGKRMGGNMTRIIQEAAGTISDKIDVEREIETSLASKKYEQKVLSVMPCAIILYMQIASPGFLDVLYHSAIGAIVMTVCLAIYACAIFWGNKIVNIIV